ncbi:MAG: hypothetical protein ABIT38_16580, partial [Gemmatimonadaceae bacterium]
ANFYDAKVGGKALIDRMQERGALNNGDSVQYARGLFVDKYRGLRRVHHGGAWAGYRAMLMRFPEQGIAIGLTCNVGDANTQMRSERVADVVLAGAFKEPATAKRKAVAAGASKKPDVAFDATAYAGKYFSDADQGVLGVSVDSGKAFVAAFGGTFPLEKATDERLTAMGGVIELDFANGRQAVTLTVNGSKAGTYSRVQAISPTAADLAELVGSYKSPEIGTTWTVRVDSGKAYITGRAVGESVMEPVIKDGYSMRSGYLAFTRDASGKINGFNVSASRMQRIRFDR